MALFMVLPWSVCARACACVTVVSVEPVTTETTCPWGGADPTPLRPASHRRHGALRSHTCVQAFQSCQPRFWSVTRRREMFTTSRAICKHTSSLPSSTPPPRALVAWLAGPPPRAPSPVSCLPLPHEPACAGDGLTGSRLVLGQGSLKAQGKPVQEAEQSCDCEDCPPS